MVGLSVSLSLSLSFSLSLLCRLHHLMDIFRVWSFVKQAILFCLNEWLYNIARKGRSQGKERSKIKLKNLFILISLFYSCLFYLCNKNCINLANDVFTYDISWFLKNFRRHLYKDTRHYNASTAIISVHLNFTALF